MMNPSSLLVEIRPLRDSDAPIFWEFRLQALQSEPQAFAESAEEHGTTSVESLAQRLGSGSGENFVLGAFDRSELVGTAGFYREPRARRRHKGRIWGVFVAPEYRGQGVGRALLVNLLERARALPGLQSVLLSVATTQEAARGLYLSLGFRPFGIEPRAFRVEHNYFDEEYMILDVSAGLAKPPKFPAR